jgi:hypothetical protein
MRGVKRSRVKRSRCEDTLYHVEVAVRAAPSLVGVKKYMV